MQNTNHIVNNITKQIVAVKSEPPPLPTTDPTVLQPVQVTPTPASIDNQLTLDEKKFDLNKLEHQNSFDNDLEKTLANLQPIANEFAAFEKDQEKIFQELIPLNDIKPTIDSCNPDQKIHFLSSTNQEVLTVNENNSKQVLANSAVKKSSPTVSCDLCNKNFSSPSKLRRHVRIVHEKIKPFNCQECGKNFGQKVNLIGHIQSRHKPNLDTNNQDQHQKQQSTIITIPITNTTSSEQGTIIQEIISENEEVHDQNTVNVEVNHASVNQEVNNQEIHHNTVNVVNHAVNHAVSAMSVNAIVVENPGPEKMQQITATASVTTNNSNKKVFKCMECVFDSEDSGDMISHHLSTHVQTMFNFDTSELLLE